MDTAQQNQVTFGCSIESSHKKQKIFSSRCILLLCKKHTLFNSHIQCMVYYKMKRKSPQLGNLAQYVLEEGRPPDSFPKYYESQILLFLRPFDTKYTNLKIGSEGIQSNIMLKYTVCNHYFALFSSHTVRKGCYMWCTCCTQQNA